MMSVKLEKGLREEKSGAVSGMSLVREVNYCAFKRSEGDRAI